MINKAEILLARVALSLGIELSAEQLAKFARFRELLQEWNKKINLTAIIEDEEIALKHFVDSLLYLQQAAAASAEYILDLGTGAGFPGIPLKILWPEKKVVLMDSLQKRMNFLAVVIDELALTDIELVHMRAEDMGKSPKYREKFDLVLSRAVAPLPVLLEYALPLVKLGGSFAPTKGKDYKEELIAAKKALLLLGGELIEDRKAMLPVKDELRVTLLIKKKRSCPKAYPRLAGTPKKKPL